MVVTGTGGTVRQTSNGSGVNAETIFTIKNNCKLTVKPALLSNVGTLIPTITGESRSIPVPNQWSGILWGRTLCSEDVIEAGKFYCITGGNFNLTSKTEFPTPPTTVAEFKLSSTDGDVYSVSLVRGFNLPMAVVPLVRTQRDCKPAGCFVDLNADCPLELRVLYQGHVVGCQNELPNFFKSSCPLSSYYAGKETTFSCECVNYKIIFCPTVRSTGSYELDEDNNVEDNSTKESIPIFKIVIVFALVFLLALFTVCCFAYLLLGKNPRLFKDNKCHCEQCICCNLKFPCM